MSRQDPSSDQPKEVLKHVSSLDGIRGLAILLVLCVHLFWANNNSSNKLANIIERITVAGWIGVDLFFVLSGFLITGILFDSLDDDHFFRNFYGRRVLRIFPLYYALIAVLFLVFPAGLANGPRPLLLLGLFLQNTPLWFHLSEATPPASLLTHLWSLATEEQFYLVWPLLVFFIRSRRGLMCTAVTGFVIALATRFVLFAHGVPGGDIYRMTICRMDTLLAGAWLALAVRGPLRDRVFRYAVYFFLGALAICGWIGLSTRSFDGNTVPLIRYGYSVLAIAGAALVAMALRPGSRASSVMSMSWLRFLGKYSYGIYMVHVAVLFALEVTIFPAVRRCVHSLVLFHLLVPPMTLAVVLPLAMLSFRYYETPFLRLKRYFNYKRGPRPKGEI